MQGYVMSVCDGFNCTKFWVRQAVVIDIILDEGLFTSGMSRELDLPPMAFGIAKGYWTLPNHMPMYVLVEQDITAVIVQWVIYKQHWKEIR